jgi:exodeoxyribonuclease (lambda-induced)
MKFIECAQGTQEWLAARCGKITASCFAEAISRCQKKSGARNVGDPTAVAERYAADLAIERISGQPHGEPPKTWVLERGHEMEAAARMRYEARTGSFVTEAGICLTDDEVFGYSTDGLVDNDGLIEIKAPIDSSKILAMWQTGDTSEYDHQMQGGMWITGRKWCDFIMYVPDLAPVGKDLFVKRIHRDEEFIDSMVEQLAAFNKLAARYEAVLRRAVSGVDEQEAA